MFCSDPKTPDLSTHAGVSFAMPHRDDLQSAHPFLEMALIAQDRWSAVTADLAIEMMARDLKDPLLFAPHIITLLGLLTPSNNPQRQAQIITCFEHFKPVWVIDELPLANMPENTQTNTQSDAPENTQSDAHRLPKYFGDYISLIEGLPADIRTRLCLRTPVLQGSHEEIYAAMTALNHVATVTNCHLSVNLTHIFTTCRQSGIGPKTLLEILNPNAIAIIELGCLSAQSTSSHIGHEVWVLFTNLMASIGLRASLIVPEEPDIDLDTLSAEAVRADKFIQITRQLGSTLGASHQIFKA